MKAMKQTATTSLTQESPKALIVNGAAYSVLFAAWVVVQLSK